MENLLLREIGSMLTKPEVIAGVMHQAAELDEHGKHLKLSTVQQAFDDLTNVWDVMFPVERYKFINEVVKKSPFTLTGWRSNIKQTAWRLS